MAHSLGRPWWFMDWKKPATVAVTPGPLRKISRLLHFHGQLDEGGDSLRLISHQLNEHQVLVFLDSYLAPQQALSIQILLFSGCQLNCRASVESSQHQGSGCRATLTLAMTPAQRQQWVRYLDQLT